MRTNLLLVFSGSSSGSSETSLLLGGGLGTVLVQKLEQLRSSVLVERMRELGNGRGNLQALVQDNLLALEADVFRPFDETSQVGGVLDILTCIAVKKVRYIEII